ncbi:hypothetical protein CBOM_07493 [Ceraceosorus bombacis]|uniref:Uncharacterized protein n=1 Tax=Ceraceosorus bombacis TaxID=401625 RepID=A0A0P1BDE1_9BASI|nr:hypothetical protein CBOM_07493 [Ceraceosorus bombacis]
MSTDDPDNRALPSSHRSPPSNITAFLSSVSPRPAYKPCSLPSSKVQALPPLDRIPDPPPLPLPLCPP